jgi:hypothetical protein
VSFLVWIVTQKDTRRQHELQLCRLGGVPPFLYVSKALIPNAAMSAGKQKTVAPLD